VINCPVLNEIWSWLQALKTDLLKQKNLLYVLLLAVSAIIIFGLAVFIIDPNIHSLADGLWFAWSTMSLVGFGDVVPTSLLGRILAGVLLLLGIVLLALLNATFSAALIGRGVLQVEQEESIILQEIKRLHERLDELEKRQ
jgi:voltage-gated potassium channel